MIRENTVKLFSFGMVLVFFLLPFLFLFLLSFTHRWNWPDLIPQAFSIRAWVVLLSDPLIVSSIYKTIGIGGMVVILNLLVALPAGKALAHYSFIGKNLLESLLLLPILVPSLAVAMGMHITLIRLGVANNWFGVILVHLIPTVPYSIRIFRAGFERLGVKYEEQAKSLGLRPWIICHTITLPLLLPSIRSVILLTFVISLSQYVLTAVIGGGNVVTLAMVYYPYFSSADRSVIASFSLLFGLLPLLFLAVVEGLIRLVPYSGFLWGGRKQK